MAPELVGSRPCRPSDLTGAQGIDSLRGVAMAWTDIVDMAGVWAAALGIEVLED